MTIVLDTMILSYAVGSEHPLRDPCRRLLEGQAQGLVDAATTVEVIQEFVHVRSRRRPRVDAVRLGRRYAEALEIIPVGAHDLDLGLALYEHYDGLGAFDAVLAAVAMNRQAEALVSADQAFRRLPNLVWVDPATSALDALLDR